MSEANFYKADLKGAWLFCTKLKGVLNLSLEQLSEVETLCDAELPQDLKEKIKKKYPFLLKDPRS